MTERADAKPRGRGRPFVAGADPRRKPGPGRPPGAISAARKRAEAFWQGVAKRSRVGSRFVELTKDPDPNVSLRACIVVASNAYPIPKAEDEQEQPNRSVTVILDIARGANDVRAAAIDVTASVDDARRSLEGPVDRDGDEDREDCGTGPMVDRGNRRG